MTYVVSGLPGSGKSTLARQITSRTRIVVLDKDDILERLFEERRVGDGEWRSAEPRGRSAVRRARDRARICVSRLVVAAPSSVGGLGHANQLAVGSVNCG